MMWSAQLPCNVWNNKGSQERTALLRSSVHHALDIMHWTFRQAVWAEMRSTRTGSDPVLSGLARRGPCRVNYAD